MIRPIYFFGILSCISFAKDFTELRKAPGIDGRFCVHKIFSTSCHSLTKCAVLCEYNSECGRFDFIPEKNMCMGCSASSELRAHVTASNIMSYVLGDQMAYIGCYIDKLVNGYILVTRQLNGLDLIMSSIMTNELCLKHCRAHGFIYSGTQFFDQCYCGNSLTEGDKQQESECFAECRGDTSQAAMWG